MASEPQVAGDGVPEIAVRYSVEELSAIAELAGLGSFPGTGEHLLEQPRERQAARRALVARGTVGAGPDGTLAIEPGERALLGCALRPGAVLSVAHARGGAVTTSLVYVTRELSVLHAEEADGVHRLAAFPTAMLPRRVAALAHLSSRDSTGGEPVALTDAELERLRAGETPEALDGGARTSSRVSVLRRDGERVAGGDVVWVDAAGRGLMAVEPRDGGAVLAPVAARDLVERLRLLLD